MSGEALQPDAASDGAGTAAFAGLGRRDRSKDGRRPCVVFLRLTEEERESLAVPAADQGVSVQRYLLECAEAVQAGGVVVETASDRREAIAGLVGVRRLLASIANNANQVAKAANSGGLPLAQSEALATFRAARRASDRVFELIDGMLAKR